MRMAIEHPVEQHTRVAGTAWRFGGRNGVQAFFTGHGTPCAIANPVQAHVRERAGRKPPARAAQRARLERLRAQGLLLASVRLYGLLAFLVTERTKEIGFVSRLVHSWADSIVVSRASFRPECRSHRAEVRATAVAVRAHDCRASSLKVGHICKEAPGLCRIYRKLRACAGWPA